MGPRVGDIAGKPGAGSLVVSFTPTAAVSDNFFPTGSLAVAIFCVVPV